MNGRCNPIPPTGPVMEPEQHLAYIQLALETLEERVKILPERELGHSYVTAKEAIESMMDCGYGRSMGAQAERYVQVMVELHRKLARMNTDALSMLRSQVREDILGIWGELGAEFQTGLPTALQEYVAALCR